MNFSNDAAEYILRRITDPIIFGLRAICLKGGVQMCHSKSHWFWIILALLFVSGCVNPGRPIPPSAGEVQTNIARSKQYCSQLYADPRIDPVRSKLPMPTSFSDSISIQMMSSNEFPTKEEAQAILAYADQRQKCMDYNNVIFGPTPVHVDAVRRSVSQLLAELYAGSINYGQYAKQLNQNFGYFIQQEATIRAQVARDQLQVQQAFQQSLFQQQQLSLERQRLQNEQFRALQPKINTPVNCTTQYIGNQAYTNCQ
jgi:hypothetical protein